MLLSDMLQGVELSAPPLDPSLARRDGATSEIIPWSILTSIRPRVEPVKTVPF